jgi:uncharacterized DUF497 family protein
MEFEWDEAKRSQNLMKHEIDFGAQASAGKRKYYRESR